MKKLLFLLAGISLLAASCTTGRIVPPPGRKVQLPSHHARCQHIKRRKILFIYGLPLNPETFSELFVGVPEPVKVVIMNTFLDNLFSNALSSHDRQGNSRGEVEIKTMDAYTCQEPIAAAAPEL
jgi:hypothetical protein